MYSAHRSWEIAVGYEFIFPVPAMSAGEIQLAVASLHEPFKNVSWLFKINNAAAPYFSQPLTPTSCHSSGGFGSRASGLIENYPADAPTTGVIVQFTVGGVVHYNATGLCQQSMSISSSGYVALSVEFDIPASPVLTSHIEDLVFQLPTNPPSAISMPFSYQALPEPSIDLGRSWLDGSQANGASPEISYTGDEQLFLIVSNLGASSTHKVIESLLQCCLPVLSSCLPTMCIFCHPMILVLLAICGMAPVEPSTLGL